MARNNNDVKEKLSNKDWFIIKMNSSKNSFKPLYYTGPYTA